MIERGCAPLECYFQLWAEHNTRVLRAVPAERLLVVRTTDIRSRIAELADWVGVLSQTLRTERSWLFAAPRKHGVLAALDPAYVRDTAARVCGPLMQAYFPDVAWQVPAS